MELAIRCCPRHADEAGKEHACEKYGKGYAPVSGETIDIVHGYEKADDACQEE